ncbi:MAG: hypothetical protein FWC92_05635, partial [Defluviitaleaceae bacterium]|nr:hypothetical protein [Defluviitaleaceae bacterium]
ELINDQWYVFYHRPPRGFGNARQAVVDPVTIQWDEKPVAEGGKVVIRAYDPHTPDGTWAANAKNGCEYTGAQVTSEGFHMYGLSPYCYYSAGIASYFSHPGTLQDSWDIWDNHMPITNMASGHIVGYKHFGFGGLAQSKKGLKPFAGTKPGDNTKFNLFLVPKTSNAFSIDIWLHGPYANEAWNGKKIGTINVPAGTANTETRFTIDVATYVEGLDKKHGIYLVAESESDEPLCDLIGLGFSSKDKDIVRVAPPAICIMVDGDGIELPPHPVRSTYENGITGYDIYEVKVSRPGNKTTIPTVTASADDTVEIDTIIQADTLCGTAIVRFIYKGVSKTYHVEF